MVKIIKSKEKIIKLNMIFPSSFKKLKTKSEMIKLKIKIFKPYFNISNFIKNQKTLSVFSLDTDKIPLFPSLRKSRTSSILVVPIFTSIYFQIQNNYNKSELKSQEN